jgi:outer membrane protein assembly factor BamE (lipoprotein component of BamABCDE complex)
MARHGTQLLMGFLLIVLVISCAYPNKRIVSCEEAAQNASKIRVGMKESEVLALLGSPGIATDDRWSYSFDCVKLPPGAGQTVIKGLDIFFRDGIVKAIKRAWADATGVVKPTKRRNQRKQPSL